MRLGKAFFISILALGVCWSPAFAGHVGWVVGVNIGGPVCRPWYPYWGYYYPPYPIYYPPAPVIVASSPVVQEPPLAQPVYVMQPQAVAPRASEPEARTKRINFQLQQLSNPDERVRADSAIQLGRLRAYQAVDPLAATLAGDRSALVREAAARALGLIGSSKALAALDRAAQIDSDRDVRHSAQYAIDVIQSRN
jgi:hypothetical protein